MTKFLKKFLYYVTVIGPVWDCLTGFLNGVLAAIQDAKNSAEVEKQIREFTDNELGDEEYSKLVAQITLNMKGKQK